VSTNTELSERVIARCDSDGLASDHPLRVLAAEFNESVATAISDPVLDNSKKMLGAWARLRKEWSAYSGEPLM
jgi:hypothetical protein